MGLMSSLFGGGDSLKKEAKRARREEEARARRVEFGTQQIRDAFYSAYNPQYYERLEKTGMDYYTPQVKTQYDDALNQLRNALSRSGMSNSTVRARRAGELQKRKDTTLLDVADQVRQLSNQRRTDVANAENTALTQLQASADPASAAAQMQGQLALQTQMPGYSPLGQVFTDVTAGLADQAELERRGTNRYDLGVANWGNRFRNVVQTVR